jgi:hypothetical protein
VYVSCDECGDPAPIECNFGARGARSLARDEGFTRVDGRDLCPRHAKGGDAGEQHPQSQ